jgi:hypothetical protein
MLVCMYICMYVCVSMCMHVVCVYVLCAYMYIDVYVQMNVPNRTCMRHRLIHKYHRRTYVRCSQAPMLRVRHSMCVQLFVCMYTYVYVYQHQTIDMCMHPISISRMSIPSYLSHMHVCYYHSHMYAPNHAYSQFRGSHEFPPT